MKISSISENYTNLIDGKQDGISSCKIIILLWYIPGKTNTRVDILLRKDQVDTTKTSRYSKMNYGKED